MAAEAMIDVMRENDGFIEALQTAVNSADFGLDHLPQLLFRIIDEHRWQCRYVRALKREVEFARFTEFATTATPAGLGTSLVTLERMCSDDRTALDALEQATTGGEGNPTGINQYTKASTGLLGGTDNNVHSSTSRESPTGNAARAALRRLRKDSPSLHARVLAGELSPHAAMLEAGFRKRMISIPIEDAERAARAIRSNASPEFIRELIDCLEGL